MSEANELTVREGAKYPDTAWGRIRAYLDNATAELSRVDLGELLAENVQLKRRLEWPAEQPQVRTPRRPPAELAFGPGELDELCGATQAEQPQGDGDVRAVARALRELRLNNPGVMALKGVTRLEERFVSRIAKLPKRTPIQGSGYTPLQLLGVVDDRDATAAARERVAELAEHAEEER